MAPPALPIVDFAGADGAALARAVGAAFADVGALHAVGLGLDPAIAAAQLDAARRFHGLPAAEKAALFTPGRVRSYRDYRDEGPADGPHHAALTVMFGPDEAALRGTVTEAPNAWPASDETVRAAVQAFDDAMDPIARRVTGLVARALDLPPAALLDHFAPATRFVRLHVYPPRPDAAVGCVAHTDHGFLAFLLEDMMGGFDVQGVDGIWRPVDPIEGRIVVLAGEVLSRWSNGRLRAPMHRARHPRAGTRYSVPYFFDPTWDAPIECLPTCRSADAPARFAPTTYRDLVLGRWGSYGGG